MVALNPTSVEVGFDLIGLVNEFHALLLKYDALMCVESFHRGHRIQFRKKAVRNIGMTVMNFPTQKGCFVYVPQDL